MFEKFIDVSSVIGLHRQNDLLFSETSRILAGT